MFRLAASSLWLALCLIGRAAPEPPAAVPANQLVVAGNACGPTALLNAFRFGNPAWQRASNAIAGDTDKQRITRIIRERGMRPSSHLIGHPRWSRKGVNLADLCDIANELTRGHFLPLVSQEVLFLKPGETQEKLLKRVHQRLDTSIAKGLPPVISLRRYAKRGQNGKPPEWIVLDAHFVTLTALPHKLEKGARSFPISYIDPWGGKLCQGVISLPERPILADSAATSPCLEAVFPQASVGKKLIHPGELTGLTVAAVLGRW
jgi:hypothetical protein